MSDVGKGFGCSATLIIAAVPILPLMFAWGWSGAHCEPVPQCQRQVELSTGLTFIGVFVVAITVGLILRCSLNAVAATREDEGRSLTFSLFATTLMGLVIGSALLGMYAVATL